MTGTQLAPATSKSLATMFENNDPLKSILKRAEADIGAAMRGSITAPQLVRAALVQVASTPALLKVAETREGKMSIVQAVMQAAAIGLMVGGPTGEAALVPRKGKAVLQPMVRGLVALAQRSKTVVAIPAHAVYPGDEFDVRLGSQLEIVHRPMLFGPDRTDDLITHVYAVVVTPSGFRDPHYMTREQVERIRAISAAKDDGPWVEHWGEMGLKTVVKRATKRYDLSPEFRAAVELDNRIETGKINEPSDLLDTMDEVQAHVVSQTQARTDELRQKVANGSKGAKGKAHHQSCTETQCVPDCPHYADEG